MTPAHAMVAAVALVCLAGLVAWRWWLAHTFRLAQMKENAFRLSVEALPAQLKELEERVKQLGYRR